MVARVAAIRGLPVWLVGGPGCGAYSVARALHQGGDPSGFVSVRGVLANAADVESRVAAALVAEPAADSLALYVERIDRQPLPVQEAILRWIDEGVRWKDRAARVRVFAQSDSMPAPGAPNTVLPALRRRLSALVVSLPPLTARRADLPAICRGLLDEIAANLNRPAATIADEALGKLAERDWPGNVEELEAVLTHALVSGSANRIETADFGPQLMDVTAPAGLPVPTRPATSPDGDSSSQRLMPDPHRLESVITELAHELKNPMVTIKTFAQHLDHLLADPELREKFVHLTTEAIDRMDGFLNELVRFSRFSTPRPQLHPVTDLLSRAVSMGEASLRQRIHMNGIPPTVEVRCDDEQLVFAFRSLIRGLLRELPGDTGIVLDCLPSGELVFRSKATGITRKLQGLLDHGKASESEPSLDFVLADTLILRNGGACRIVRVGDQLEVRVSLPPAVGGS